MDELQLLPTTWMNLRNKTTRYAKKQDQVTQNPKGEKKANDRKNSDVD